METMPKEERCHRKSFTGILDRYLKDPQYRQSQEESGWDEAKREEIDKMAQEDSLLPVDEVRTPALFIKLKHSA